MFYLYLSHFHSKVLVVYFSDVIQCCKSYDCFCLQIFCLASYAIEYHMMMLIHAIISQYSLSISVSPAQLIIDFIIFFLVKCQHDQPHRLQQLEQLPHQPLHQKLQFQLRLQHPPLVAQWLKEGKYSFTFIENT